MNFTNKQIEEAKKLQSVKELLAFAKENGIELTEEAAAKYFAELHAEGELADAELDNVAGGICDDEEEEKPDDTPKYHGYPIRDSAWAPCEDFHYHHCGQCPYFCYMSQEDRQADCNGYCTKG